MIRPLSVAEVRQAIQRVKKPSKYHAVRVTVDGIQFASKKEAKRYGELKRLERVDQIQGLICQPRFELFAWTGTMENPVSVGFYVADFEYIDRVRVRRIIEDVKSAATRTPLYRLKKKLAEACHGITITEV